jgi:hypothetical protein
MSKLKTTLFRSPYYEISDAISDFKNVATSKKDAKLKAKVLKLQKELDSIHKHLESKYIWD